MLLLVDKMDKGSKWGNVMNFIKGEEVRTNPLLKKSFFQLAEASFGLEFEKWDALGYWKDTYCPYAFEVDGEIVANVSTSIGTLIVDGQALQVVQIGTVMTKPAYRKRGLSSQLLHKVLEDNKHAEFMYLFANDTVLDFYPKFGFEQRQQASFMIQTTSLNLHPTEIKKLNMDDDKSRKLLYETLIHRMPVSLRLGVLQNEDIVMYHALTQYKDCIYSAPKLNVIIIAEELEDRIVIVDIISKYPVHALEVLQQLPIQQKKIELGFTPSDEVAFVTTGIAMDKGTLFVRKQGEKVYPEHVLFPLSAMA